MSTKVPPFFCVWNSLEKIKIMLMTLIMAMAMESPCIRKKLEVTNCDHKINLKQEVKNGLLVSNSDDFLKYEIKRRPLFQ